MTRRACASLAVLTLAGGLTVIGAPQTPQRQVFRALTSLVTVEAMIFDGNKLVPGLTARDFIVQDNGVTQEIELLDVESLPVDLTIVVDTSGSVEGMIEDIRLYVKNAVDVLRVDDRFRLITFAGEVRDHIGLQSPTTAPPIETIVADGSTAIYDAVIASLMRTRRGDRRQIVVAFTDGYETNSNTTIGALQAVAARSDSVLYMYIVKDAFRNPRPIRYLDTRAYWLTRFEHDLEGLGAAARATGGWLDDVYTRPQLPGRLRQTLEEFRTSYVLRYRPVGVAPGGWHAISVKTTSGSHRVRARSGYFWGS